MSIFNFLRRTEPKEDQVVYGPKAQARRDRLTREGLDPDRQLPFTTAWDEEEVDEDGEPIAKLYAAQIAYTGADEPGGETCDLTMLIFLVPDGVKYIEDCPAEVACRIARKGEYSKAVAWIATEWSARHSQTGFSSIEEAKESLTDFFAHAGMSSSVSDPTGSLRAWARRHDGSGFPELDVWSTAGFEKKSHRFFSENTRVKAGRRGALGQLELDDLKRQLEELLGETNELVDLFQAGQGRKGKLPTKAQMSAVVDAIIQAEQVPAEMVDSVRARMTEAFEGILKDAQEAQAKA